MPYALKYTFSFKDRHTVSPATWRVDILDGEEAAGSVYTLMPSGDPLITERIETDDEKATYIIGRQITFSYEYTGAPNEPLPELFFEANERRWRVEVYRNNVLDGVYYIKPDFSSRQWKAAPFTITLKAVDGLSYAKGVLFRMTNLDNTLQYEKISLYEAIMTKALLQVVDEGTPINLLCSLSPTNIEPGKRLLNGTFVHTDVFYDFVKGASSVHDVLTTFCKAFYARCFIAAGQVWFVRMQDLTGDTFTVERYIDEDTVSEVDVPELLATAGPEVGLYDAVSVDDYPEMPMVAALKKAEFEADYKGINRVLNFEWANYSSGVFDDWDTNPTFPITVSREGAGTLEDPYKLFVPYPQSNPGLAELRQVIPSPVATLGDVLDVQMKFLFNNVKNIPIRITIRDSDGDTAFSLDSSGKWQQGVGSPVTNILVTRSGKKRSGSLNIKSDPIPVSVPGITEQTGPFQIRIQIGIPGDPEEMEPSEPDGVLIYPIKIGVIDIASKGRHLTITNRAQFSRIKDDAEQFTFIDTGDEGASNTIFTGIDQEPVDSWQSTKPAVAPDDIERHMARAHVDQYRRSLQSWEGALYSNTLEYFSTIEFPLLPGKRFMQLRDTYNNLTCTHECSLIEIMEEGSAQVDILEYDIEEERE